MGKPSVGWTARIAYNTYKTGRMNVSAAEVHLKA
jgi:hypothetical protein